MNLGTRQNETKSARLRRIRASRVGLIRRVAPGFSIALVLAASACGATKASSGGDASSDAKLALVDASPAPLVPVDVLTQRNDVSRTGQNVNESILNTRNVNAKTFGKLFSLPVQGLVYAQPLIVSGLTIGGKTRDVLIVATMHNMVYAFDAKQGGNPLWKVSLGPSVPSSEIGAINPETGKPQGTLNIQVEVGILSTPVIDRANGYIYLTRKDFTNSVQSQMLHVLSLTTGQDMPGSPAVIKAQVAGFTADGGEPTTVTLDAPHHAQRPGLLLWNGNVYMGFASHEDNPPFHGWIVSYRYDAAAKTLTQAAVFCVTPDGDEGGIWQSGQGLTTDGTSLYAMTSNGTVSVQSGGESYGESFLKLSSDLKVQDWFVPVNYGSLNKGDIDVGAGGPVLIPGTSPQLVTGGGKQGILYLVDTTSMGHMGTVDDLNTQEFHAVPLRQSIFGAPAIWTGTGTPRLYMWGTGDVLREYVFNGSLFETTPAAMSDASIATPSVELQDPVGILSVSSNGSKPGTGIVWATKPLTNPDHTTVPGTFYAFDALTLTELWDTTQNASRDGFGNYAKFVPPTIANGKVYLATHSQQVVVYGPLGDGDGDLDDADGGT